MLMKNVNGINMPLVVALGAALGLTEAQIDNAWREASSL